MRYDQCFHHTSQIWEIFHHQQTQETPQIKDQHIRQFIISRCWIMFQMYSPFFSHPTTTLLADSPGRRCSITAWEACRPGVSTHVPGTREPRVAIALEVFSWVVQDEVKLREMLFPSIWQLTTHLVLFITHLSPRKCWDWSTANIPAGEVTSWIEGTPRSWARGNGL